MVSYLTFINNYLIVIHIMNTSSFKSCAHSSYYTSYFIRIVCVHDSCRSHYESMVYSSSCCRNYAYHGIYVIL